MNADSAEIGYGVMDVNKSTKNLRPWSIYMNADCEDIEKGCMDPEKSVNPSKSTDLE